MKQLIIECPHCMFLTNAFSFNDMTPREYWLFTEVFIYLHNGKDYCEFIMEVKEE